VEDIVYMVPVTIAFKNANILYIFNSIIPITNGYMRNANRMRTLILVEYEADLYRTNAMIAHNA
jgi:hypothetical protein